MTQTPKCKGCSSRNDYGEKYAGYCLQCFNSGVPELDEQIRGLRGLLHESLEWLDKYSPYFLLGKEMRSDVEAKVEALCQRIEVALKEPKP